MNNLWINILGKVYVVIGGLFGIGKVIVIELLNNGVIVYNVDFN